MFDRFALPLAILRTVHETNAFPLAPPPFLLTGGDLPKFSLTGDDLPVLPLTGDQPAPAFSLTGGDLINQILDNASQAGLSSESAMESKIYSQWKDSLAPMDLEDFLAPEEEMPALEDDPIALQNLLALQNSTMRRLLQDQNASSTSGGFFDPIMDTYEANARLIAGLVGLLGASKGIGPAIDFLQKIFGTNKTFYRKWLKESLMVAAAQDSNCFLIGCYAKGWFSTGCGGIEEAALVVLAALIAEKNAFNNLVEYVGRKDVEAGNYPALELMVKNKKTDLAVSVLQMLEPIMRPKGAHPGNTKRLLETLNLADTDRDSSKDLGNTMAILAAQDLEQADVATTMLWIIKPLLSVANLKEAASNFLKKTNAGGYSLATVAAKHGNWEVIEALLDLAVCTQDDLDRKKEVEEDDTSILSRCSALLSWCFKKSGSVEPVEDALKEAIQVLKEDEEALDEDEGASKEAESAPKEEVKETPKNKKEIKVLAVGDRIPKNELVILDLLLLVSKDGGSSALMWSVADLFPKNSKGEKAQIATQENRERVFYLLIKFLRKMATTGDIEHMEKALQIVIYNGPQGSPKSWAQQFVNPALEDVLEEVEIELRRAINNYKWREASTTILECDREIKAKCAENTEDNNTAHTTDKITLKEVTQFNNNDIALIKRQRFDASKDLLALEAELPKLNAQYEALQLKKAQRPEQKNNEQKEIKSGNKGGIFSFVIGRKRASTAVVLERETQGETKEVGTEKGGDEVVLRIEPKKPEIELQKLPKVSVLSMLVKQNATVGSSTGMRATGSTEASTQQPFSSMVSS